MLLSLLQGYKTVCEIIKNIALAYRSNHSYLAVLSRL